MTDNNVYDDTDTIAYSEDNRRLDRWLKEHKVQIEAKWVGGTEGDLWNTKLSYTDDRGETRTLKCLKFFMGYGYHHKQPSVFLVFNHFVDDAVMWENWETEWSDRGDWDEVNAETLQFKAFVGSDYNWLLYGE